MLESAYQNRIIKRLKQEFPGAFVLKNDTDYIQGIPDLTVLYFGPWAVLEVKASLDAPFQPNQEYYLEQLGHMSYAAVICPETEEEVFDELRAAFEPFRPARVPLS